MTIEQAIKRGIGYGLLATLVMTLIMATGMTTGMAPMPEPVPKAIASLVLGLLVGQVSSSVAMISGMIAHFGYGAAAGAVFALCFKKKSNWKTGLLWGAILWVIMQVLVLPLIGWGFFGIEVTGFPPKIAVGTLVLHLIYGTLLGWGVGRTNVQS